MIKLCTKSVRYSLTPFFGRSSDNVPKPRKRFDGVFGIVVVPWHPVVTQEREKFVAVFLEALFAFGGRFALEIGSVEESIEPIDLDQAFPQEMFLQSARVDGCDHGL